MHPSASSSKAVLRPLRPLSSLPNVYPSASASSLIRLPPRHISRSQHIARRSLFSLPDISKLANLAGALKESTGVDSDGEEQRFHARKILPYSQVQLYSLVSDVPSYSSFIPFCTSSRVLVSLPPGSPQNSRRTQSEWKPDHEPFDVEAELKVGFGGLEERYISRVQGKPFESVTATASDKFPSPLFKSLKTTWSFSPASSLSPHASASSLPASRSTTPDSRIPNSTTQSSPEDGPTLLTIDLAFSFANPLHRIASQAVLPKVADKMVEAFEKRCLEVWGKGSE